MVKSLSARGGFFCKLHPTLSNPGKMKNRMFIYLVFTVAAVFTTSCKTPRKSSNNASGDPEREFRTSQLAEANNRFALDLFKQVHPANENIIFSPYSISNVMALIYGGAAGNTAGEISEVFYFPGDPMQLHRAVQKLGQSLDSINMNPGTELRIANANWVQNDFDFLLNTFRL